MTLGTRGRPGRAATRRVSRTRGLDSARRRFERRASRVRRRPWRVAAAALALVVAAAVVVWALAISSLFAVRTVTVTGLTDARERSAATAAAAVVAGTPLARVDTGAVAARVTEIPTVGEVKVSRSWPGTIVVAVTRRQPVLAVRLPSSRIQLVDATGLAYSTVASVPRGVPLVTSSAATPAPEGLQAAASVLTILPSSLRAKVGGVTVTSADLVTFTLGGVTVRWGGLADGAKKLAVLQVLLRTSPTTIDVSAPDTPTTT
ncbi:FtsQ-type POTRA domain-containing protein [Dermatophilaceae bacterium Soc4.6]